MNLDSNFDNDITEDATNDVALKYSVPLHNSSVNTKDFFVLLCIIDFNSYISTWNDDEFVNILSFPNIL